MSIYIQCLLSLPLIVSRGHVLLLLLRGHLIGGRSNAPHSMSYPPWPIVASLIHLRLHIVANRHLLLDPLLRTPCTMNVYNIGIKLWIYNPPKCRPFFFNRTFATQDSFEKGLAYKQVAYAFFQKMKNLGLK